MLHILTFLRFQHLVRNTLSKAPEFNKVNIYCTWKKPDWNEECHATDCTKYSLPGGKTSNRTLRQCFLGERTKPESSPEKQFDVVVVLGGEKMIITRWLLLLWWIGKKLGAQSYLSSRVQREAQWGWRLSPSTRCVFRCYIRRDPEEDNYGLYVGEGSFRDGMKYRNYALFT